jgi:hypothetical protein
VPRNEEHGKNSAREGANEHRILNAKPISPEFLAAVIRELTVKFCPSSAIPATIVSVAAVAAIFPSVASNPVNPATTTHSGNLATTSRKFVKVSVKFGTSELQSIAIIRDYHARTPKHCHRSGLSCQSQRVSYGIRDQEAKKQLLQVYKHHHQ